MRTRKEIVDFILNIALSYGVMFALFMWTVFSLGWADSGHHEHQIWQLYILFLLAHLIYIFWNLYKTKRLSFYNLLFSIAGILVLNGIIIWYYKII